MALGDVAARALSPLRTAKHPRLVDLMPCESVQLLRADVGRPIARAAGLSTRNAGVDESNPGVIEHASARPQRLRPHCARRDCAVMIGDSFGRPWRIGQVVGRDRLRQVPLEASRPAPQHRTRPADDADRPHRPGRARGGHARLERHVLADDGAGAAALLRAPADDRLA